MTSQERAQEIACLMLEGKAQHVGWSVADEINLIASKIDAALIEQREAIAKMAGDWHKQGQRGYCPPSFSDLAQAIREGHTCIHEWIDIRNKVIESGEMCRRCGALRAGNEATSGNTVL